LRSLLCLTATGKEACLEACRLGALPRLAQACTSTSEDVQMYAILLQGQLVVALTDAGAREAVLANFNSALKQLHEGTTSAKISEVVGAMLDSTSAECL